MKDDRTGWSSGVNTAILLVLLLVAIWIGGLVVAVMLHGWGIQVRAQTRPVWPLPQCDDVKPAGTFACILVSEEHWGGNLPRSPVVFTCLKIDNVLQSCWLGGN